jgi:alpha-L-fucosidase
MKHTFKLTREYLTTGLTGIVRVIRDIVTGGTDVTVVVAPAVDKRTRQQNDLMWAMLGDIAQQKQWPVDGRMQWLEPEEWKHILTAGLKKHQRVAQGIDGGFVILGQRTSRMSVQEMTDLIELAFAFGAENGVVFGEVERAA